LEGSDHNPYRGTLHTLSAGHTEENHNKCLSEQQMTRPIFPTSHLQNAFAVYQPGRFMVSQCFSFQHIVLGVWKPRYTRPSKTEHCLCNTCKANFNMVVRFYYQ